jgi:hypothetical protein
VVVVSALPELLDSMIDSFVDVRRLFSYTLNPRDLVHELLKIVADIDQLEAGVRVLSEQLKRDPVMWL